MGTVLAVSSCGGPVLSFRGGRVDAFAAERSGVPEPQPDLESHIEILRLQGFNATEMISLVVCGHTFGGVRNLDFPEIVPLDKEDPSIFKVATFDSTIQVDATV
jgi:catalase (peroxidase I)